MADSSGTGIMHQVNLHDNPTMASDEYVTNGANDKTQDIHGSAQKSDGDDFALFSPDSVVRKQQHNANVTRGYGFLPRSEPTVADGFVLPHRFEPVPALFYNQPIEEIENGITEQTFCVLSSKIGRTYVYRFAATDSCFAFSPWNPARKICIAVITNQYFEYVMMITVIANFIFFLFGLDTSIPGATLAFLILYIIEMILKSIAYGFALGKYTYLRSGWNWLDFILNIERVVDMFIDLGNIEVLRMFRIFKILAHFKGYQRIFGTLSRFMKMFFQIMLLTIFFVAILALFTVDTFKGMFKHKCGSHDNETNEFDGMDHNSSCYPHCYPWSAWEVHNSLGHICGHGTGAFSCPGNLTCLEDEGSHPNYDSTSFDDFGSAMVTTFQIMCLNSWNDVYDDALSSSGPYVIIIFILIIFLGTFYLLNLVLAALVFCCERETNSYHDSMSNKSEIDVATEESTMNGNKSTQGLVADDQFPPDHNCECCASCCICYNVWLRFQRLIERFVTNCFVHYFFIACIIGNTVLMALDHHGMPPELELFLRRGSYVFLIIFTIEITLKVIAFSRDYFKDSYNVLDFFIVLLAILELVLENVFGLSVLRALRVFRLLRLSRTSDTKQPKTPLVVLRLVVDKTMDSLGNVCFVLFVGAMIFGVLGREAIGRSYQHQMEINNGTLPSHLQVTERLHFLDSLHSVYLILRVMFGDWIEPLTQCMRGIGGQTCTLIIFPALIFGRFLVLGVFLAIIITTFRREYQSTIEKKKDDAPSMCTRGLNWVKEAIYSCCTHPILSPPPGDESKIRRRFSRVIDNRYFGWSVLIIVFINCVVLCMENILLKRYPSLEAAVQVLNGIFCTFYIFELLCKLIGHGFHSYFSTGSTILEFVIVASLLLNVSQLVKEEWCVLRALVALRLASRWTAIKMVASILLSTIPSILYVTLVSSVFWAIFAIMGVQMFGGKFLHCVDYDFQRVHHSDVPNRTHCDVMNYTWVNSELNFDNVARGVVALLQVVTFQKWEEVTSSAVDVSHGIDLQPVTDNNVHLYAFFFIVVLYGAFYPFSLFVGIIIENFNKLAEKHEGGILNVFLSERWRKYLSAIEKEDGKPMERPSSKLRAFCYDLSVNIRFELFMLVIILVNMICMMVQSYEGESPLFRGWPILSIVFTIVLTVEAIIKIIGMRRDYFKKAWNLFDFLVVIFAILDIILLETLHNSVRLGRELRLVRLLRFYRIPRVEKVLNGGKLLSVITKSFPAHLTLSALLFLVMFAYAAIGTLLFANIKLTGVLNQVLNFETVGHSMVMLFRLFTSGFWYDVLVALRIEFPDCGYDDPTNTDCGPSCPATVVLFITSYIIINFMIITIYAAVVLHNFKEIYQQDDIVNDIDMFFVTWTKYDPTATQFISLWKVPNFLHHLEPPLRIAKPNGRTIASFNMPIAIGPVVHCMDILNALLNNVTRKDKESDDTNRVQELAEQSFKKYFPIRKHLELNTASQEWNKDDLAATLDQNVSNQQNIWIEADLSAA